jgi:hypothetical protein
MRKLKLRANKLMNLIFVNRALISKLKRRELLHKINLEIYLDSFQITGIIMYN